MAELEDLFRSMDDNPPTRDEWIRTTARALLYAWDEGLTIPQLSRNCAALWMVGYDRVPRALGLAAPLSTSDTLHPSLLGDVSRALH